MKVSKKIFNAALIGTVVTFFGATVVADDTKRDNSAVNARDTSVTERTADNQPMEKTDTELTRRIRKDIHERAGLSTYAKNIKIISEAGRVTLKGPVRTQAEKNTISTIASRAAGARNVSNELEIVPME